MLCLFLTSAEDVASQAYASTKTEKKKKEKLTDLS